MAANTPPEIGLDDAYSLSNPADAADLYNRWAESYEGHFAASHGYMVHARVAERFAEVAVMTDGPVLDVGCGTGLVGAELAVTGHWALDGLDISSEMLAQAAEKLNPAGEPVYGSLIRADLTKPLEISDDTYGSVVTAGTFTTGHVGPEAVVELVRIVRPGGLLVLGINRSFYDESDFAGRLSWLVDDHIITRPSRREVRSYDGADHAHADDTTYVVVTRVEGQSGV